MSFIKIFKTKIKSLLKINLFLFIFVASPLQFKVMVLFIFIQEVQILIFVKKQKNHLENHCNCRLKNHIRIHDLKVLLQYIFYNDHKKH